VYGSTINTTTTLQVVVNPHTLPSDSIGDAAWNAFSTLNPEYPRFVPWYPYPKLAVAELEPPTANSTSWDFTLIDPFVMPFLNRSMGRKPIINFSTIPTWMFNTSTWSYPADLYEVDFDYNQGTELLDPTGTQAADYFARLVSWYTAGGFTDELGTFHASDHHFSFPNWEVLNEVDAEHNTTVEDYTIRYDAIVSAINAVSPSTKFVALALAQPSTGWQNYFPYFLNASNHKPGTPIDWISYHFYAHPTINETVYDWQYTFFSQADTFVEAIRGIEGVRKELSPRTGTMLNEIGVILPYGNDANETDTIIPREYWNAAGALYAYVYFHAAQLGIEVVGESQLVGYPSQFPSVTEIDWHDGSPNARFRILQLLSGNIGAGDEFLATGDVDVQGPADGSVVSFGFMRKGESQKSVLLINKLYKGANVTVDGAAGGTLRFVDTVSGAGPVGEMVVRSDSFQLGNFSVAVLKMLD